MLLQFWRVHFGRVHLILGHWRYTQTWIICFYFFFLLFPLFFLLSTFYFLLSTFHFLLSAVCCLLSTYSFLKSLLTSIISNFLVTFWMNDWLNHQWLALEGPLPLKIRTLDLLVNDFPSKIARIANFRHRRVSTFCPRFKIFRWS